MINNFFKILRDYTLNPANGGEDIVQIRGNHKLICRPLSSMTVGILRGVVDSKFLLLLRAIGVENSAYNGEALLSLVR